MARSSHPQPRHVRYSVRQQARLDSDTHAKLEALVITFHKKRAQVLRHVMQWGLTRLNEWTIDRSIPTAVYPVTLLMDSELCQQVQDAAAAHGVTMAAWLRHAMRQVTLEDFPASWRAGDTGTRSHDSSYFHRKFGLRLDAVTSRKLEALMHTFDRSAAAIIRQLITQAQPEEFPESWHLAVREHQQEGEA